MMDRRKSGARRRFRHISHSPAKAGAIHHSATLLRLVLIIAFAALSGWWPMPGSARAAVTITFLPGTVSIDAGLQDALAAALADAPQATAHSSYFAVSALQGADGWLIVSLAGFVQPDAAGAWSLEDANWVGIALAEQQPGGAWLAAVEKTAAFGEMLQRAPDTLLDANAKASLMPGRLLGPAATTSYRFPWQPGYNMYYGMFGLHAGGYSGLGDYKAVDFLSDGNTSAGHAPNQLLAAAAGSINYVCKGPSNAAIRVGEVMYLHLQITNTNLYVGRSFAQLEPIGPMQPGNFSDYCGWASQNDGWFHVHWAFPNTGSFQVSGWSLTWVPTSTVSSIPWVRDAVTVNPGQWMQADFMKTSYFPVVYH